MTKPRKPDGYNPNWEKPRPTVRELLATGNRKPNDPPPTYAEALFWPVVLLITFIISLGFYHVVIFRF